jgi:hypothetical protein
MGPCDKLRPNSQYATKISPDRKDTAQGNNDCRGWGL